MHRFPKKSINRPLILSPGGVYGWMDQCLEYIFIPNTIWPLLSRGISFLGGGWGTHIQWHVTVRDKSSLNFIFNSAKSITGTLHKVMKEGRLNNHIEDPHNNPYRSETILQTSRI